MLLHHIISIAGCGMVLYLQISGTELIAVIFGSEATNPFLQGRWFLRQSHKHKTWYGELNDLIFILLFGFLRLGVGSNLLKCYMLHPKPILAARIGGILFYSIGVIWYIQILKYARRKYSLMFKSWTRSGTVFVDSDSDNSHSGAVDAATCADRHQNGIINNGYQPDEHKEKLS